MVDFTQDQIRTAVRTQYGAIARGAEQGCCSGAPCGPGASASLALGYSEKDLDSVPEGANMGLGCGNPQLIAALKPGETVIDLGSGGGFDCFLAARQVGPEGRVIGIDMTPDMITKARNNAEKLKATNVSFRLGEIEHLPVEDAAADVIVSNCVINLSPDKNAVYRDSFRVLKPGGRLAISDVVTLRPLPREVQENLAALTGCVSGAVDVATIEAHLADAGFENVQVRINEASADFIRQWLPNSGIEQYVAAATVEAVKPGQDCCAPACCAETST